MERLDDKEKVLLDIVIGIFRANGAFLRSGDEVARPVGLTSARWQVLGVVDHGPASVSQVGRIMGISRQGVQRTADSLAEDGMVRYVRNPHHRRAKLIEITARGKEALDYVEDRQTKWAIRVGEGFSLEDLQTTLRVLNRLTDENQLANDTSEEGS